MDWDKVKTDEITFKLRKLVCQTCLDAGITMLPERFDVQVLYDEVFKHVVRAIVKIATMEEPIHRYPADWWNMFKERYFPEWLKRWMPVQWKQVQAIHKFPEVNVPSTIGREFVHLKVIDEVLLETEMKRKTVTKEDVDEG